MIHNELGDELLTRSQIRALRRDAARWRIRTRLLREAIERELSLVPAESRLRLAHALACSRGLIDLHPADPVHTNSGRTTDHKE